MGNDGGEEEEPNHPWLWRPSWRLSSKCADKSVIWGQVNYMI